MPRTYSTYEAKAKLSEIIRRVRSGQRVIISYRGANVAEIRPIESVEDLESRIRLYEERGILEAPAKRRGSLRPFVKRRGALSRFLESRE